MSKGLTYLATMRPEAMTGLLEFYGKSVTALDDKTRLLISVVTKVATGTERGLRQYAPKAIAAGASKEELLDAVLMAFPAAGLTKVVDAVHLLLEMNLLPPLPKAESPSVVKIELGALDQFSLQKLHVLERNDERFLVFRSSQDDVRVYRSECPHRQGDLTGGKCEGTVLECPVHHWKFDLVTSQNLDSSRPNLVPLPYELQDGNVVLLLQSA